MNAKLAKTSSHNTCRPVHGLSDACQSCRLAELERVGVRGAVLDIGCGDGSFLLLAQQHGWRVAGVKSPGTSAIPATLTDHVCPVLEEGRWPAGYFDAVTVWETMDDRLNPALLLQCAAHYCRVDGILGVALDGETPSPQPAVPEEAAPLHCFSLLALHRFLGRFGFRMEWVVGNVPPRRSMPQFFEHPGRTLTRALQAFRQPEQEQHAETAPERGGITVLARYVP